MYVRNTDDQPIGFVLLDRNTLAGAPGKTVTVKYSFGDGIEHTGAGAVTDLGGGHYTYMMSAADTDSPVVSFAFFAPDTIVCEKTILPFDFPGLPAVGSPFLIDALTGDVTQIRLDNEQDNAQVQIEYNSPSFHINSGSRAPATPQLSLVWIPQAPPDPGILSLMATAGGSATGRPTAYQARDSAGNPFTGAEGTIPGGGLVVGGLVVDVGGGPGSIDWSEIGGTPTDLAGYGITSPLDHDQGGTDLTGPAADGDVLTGAGGDWTSAKPPGFVIDHVEDQTGGTITDHALPSTDILLTGSTLTYDGSIVCVELFLPLIVGSGSTTVTTLYLIDDQGNGYGAVSPTRGTGGQCLYAKWYAPVDAAASQLMVVGINTAGTTTWVAGTGTGTDAAPAFLRQSVP